MKKKDIEVDGVYAVAEQHQWMPSHYDARRGRVAAKAKVLEVGVPRRGSATQDGVKIQLLERMSGVYGRHVGDTIVVSSREVRELCSPPMLRTSATLGTRRMVSDGRLPLQ